MTVDGKSSKNRHVWKNGFVVSSKNETDFCPQSGGDDGIVYYCFGFSSKMD